GRGQAFGRARSRSRRRPRGRVGRWLRAVGAVVAPAVVVASAVVLMAWRDTDRAREQLEDVRQTLVQAVAGPAVLADPQGRTDLAALLAAAAEGAEAAGRDLEASRPLSLIGWVPGGREQRAGLLGLAGDASAAARVLSSMVAGIDQAAAGAAVEGSTVPLDALGLLAAEAERGGSALARLDRGSDGLVPPLAAARDDLDELLRSTAGRLEGAAGAIEATRGFLGAAGPRRHLIAVQNNAEMRDQGLVASYGVLRVEGGRFSLERSGSVLDLTLDAPADVALPPGTEAVFGSLFPTQTWQSVNATADFALSGAAMAAMYRQATGTAVDGVIGVDVPALAALLGALGPVDVPPAGPGGGPAAPGALTAANAAQFLLHDQYEGLPPLADTSGRRDRLADLTGAVVERLGSAGDAMALGQSLGGAAGGGHLRLWSADPGEQGTFERAGLAGGPVAGQSPEVAARTFHLAVQNRTATKLDWFVHPEVHLDVRLTPGGDAVVWPTLTIENRAPVGAAPSYRLGPDGFTGAPGDYVGWVLLWSPVGSQVAGSVSESGLELTERVVAVGAGQSATVRLGPVTVPGAVRDGQLALRLVPQPRAHPVPLTVTLDPGRWRAGVDERWKGTWDRSLTLSWPVSR
ncbi:MAG: DUF4012 domain-containing protein, partial [Actinomycetota bacterium]